MSTTNAMSVGDTFTGTLDTLGDNDWVSVTLTGGARYTIDLLAAGSGNGTLADSYLRIHDANGALVAENDDGGAGYDSRVTVTATTGGSYFISAGAYNNSSTGTYQVQVSPAAALNDGTLDDLATYLTDGYWASVGGARHSFDTTSSNIITANLTALDSRGQALARNAMEAWEAVADIRFQEITGSAQITFDDSQSGAYTSYSTLGSSTQNATVNISTTWLDTYGTQYDDYSQSTYIHELGHALGLGHQGPYNGSASYPGDAAFTNDSYQLSVMSYFSQSENTDVTASYALQLTAMAADIVAIQTLYGAPGTSSQTAGDTVYGAGQTVGGYLGDFFTILATGSDPQSHYGGGPVTLTLYDQGGIDLVDVSFDTFDQVIDLGDLGLWNTGGLIGNVIVARGTVLENVSAGSGNDHVIGNSANNTILGNNGNDTLDGGVGDDLLNGGVGNDTLNGGAGMDRFVYLSGQDVIEDFSGDLIQIARSAWSRSVDSLLATAQVQNGNLVLALSVDNTLTLTGITSIADVSGRVRVGAFDPSHDHTGDGIDDILWRNSTNGQVGMFEMVDGRPTWGLISNTGLDWTIEGTGDFSGDGTDDILWRHTSGAVGMFEMDTGSPVWNSIGQAGSEWNIVGVGDFNGDNTDDILWRNSITGGTGTFAMSNGSPTWQTIGASGAAWLVAGTGDFNGDGTDDILWRRATTGQVGMFEMTNGSPTWQLVSNTGPEWMIAGTGDFNGDGTDDILWRHATTGQVGMFEMIDGNPTWSGMGVAGGDWDIQGTGDFNGDGTDDILWRNTTTGQVGMYEMHDGDPTWSGIGSASADWNVAGFQTDEFLFA
ncbi:FG-GAP-like repeat-containing protein [Nioella nitratireducens]|uniref:FG-GAP-like repeat-containing protein n=1 Tax=Nioella nitratireducens TaxID=1287720 RepID=UPI0008FD77C0|nr:FG-GAP-like repeat-containing protein [Nioella nitratireducens]